MLGQHWTEGADFREEVGEGMLRAEEAEHMRSDDDAAEQQSDDLRHVDSPAEGRDGLYWPVPA